MAEDSDPAGEGARWEGVGEAFLAEVQVFGERRILLIWKLKDGLWKTKKVGWKDNLMPLNQGWVKKAKRKIVYP